MKQFFILVFILLTFSGKSQIDFTKEIEKDIFRATATVPSLSIAIWYERKVKKTFSIVLKAGPAFNVRSSSFSNNGKSAWNIFAFGAAEGRYYYNLKYRIKKGKNVRNFSASYFGIEQFVISNPIISINQPRANIGGSTGLSLNIGFQNQTSKHFYYSAFLGVKVIGGNVEGAYTAPSDPLRLGITIGNVF